MGAKLVQSVKGFGRGTHCSSAFSCSESGQRQPRMVSTTTRCPSAPVCPSAARSTLSVSCADSRSLLPAIPRTGKVTVFDIFS